MVEFTLPESPGSDHWVCLIDTNMPVREELPSFNSGDRYQVTGRLLLLFALYPRSATRRIFERLESHLNEWES